MFLLLQCFLFSLPLPNTTGNQLRYILIIYEREGDGVYLIIPQQGFLCEEGHKESSFSPAGGFHPLKKKHSLCLEGLKPEIKVAWPLVTRAKHLL